MLTCKPECWLSLVCAVQKLLSECQSYRDCQLPVNHLLFGKDPCPGTTKYLHVDYKCKPSEFSSSVLPPQFPTASVPITSSSFFVSPPHLGQLNTKDMWCATGGRWSCAASPPGSWTSMQLSTGEAWARAAPAPRTWPDHPHSVSLNWIFRWLFFCFLYTGKQRRTFYNVSLKEEKIWVNEITA